MRFCSGPACANGLRPTGLGRCYRANVFRVESLEGVSAVQGIMFVSAIVIAVRALSVAYTIVELLRSLCDDRVAKLRATGWGPKFRAFVEMKIVQGVDSHRQTLYENVMLDSALAPFIAWAMTSPDKLTEQKQKQSADSLLDYRSNFVAVRPSSSADAETTLDSRVLLPESRGSFLLRVATNSLELALAAFRVFGCATTPQIIYIAMKCVSLTFAVMSCIVAEYVLIGKNSKK